jgi:NADH dehydrogenase (ubiquinone) Fe-S protein 1
MKAAVLISGVLMLRTQDLANRLGSGNLKVEAGAPLLDADVRSNYLANSTISGIDRADVILLIGTNPRVEAPVFNARYRQLPSSSSLNLCIAALLEGSRCLRNSA